MAMTVSGNLIPWLESAAVIFLAAFGVFLGWWCSRLPRQYWIVGYLLPLVLIVLYGLANAWLGLSLQPPISWMMMGRNKFAVAGFICAMVLTTPLSRIKPARSRVAIATLMGLMVFNFSVWPFLAPAFNRQLLATMQTQFNKDDVCLQTTDYTCGPAAAVTALRKLGFHGEEGQIALWAHTSTATGTPPDILARTLQERYGQQGLVAQFKVFHNLEELAEERLTLAVIKYNWWMDHYVTVLEVTTDKVLTADPSLGLVSFSHEEFLKKWRAVGVTLKRDPLAQPAANRSVLFKPLFLDHKRITNES